MVLDIFAILQDLLSTDDENQTFIEALIQQNVLTRVLLLLEEIVAQASVFITNPDETIFANSVSLLKSGLSILTNVCNNKLAKRDLFKRNIFEFATNTLKSLEIYSQSPDRLGQDSQLDPEILEILSRFLRGVTENFDCTKHS